MPNIKYVCLSDTHFGADNSVLTNLDSNLRVDPTAPSPTLVQLVKCLRQLIDCNEERTRPTLILNGDIFEFALATDNIAALAFQRFLELAMPLSEADRIFDDRIIYLPGNHDHHLWEVARERQYTDYIRQSSACARLEPPWHTTKMIGADPVPSSFVEAIVSRCNWLNTVSVSTIYPNFALRNQKTLTIFTHGHFTEAIYTLMTTMAELMFPETQKQLRSTYDWEAQNFAWIDFFWSVMGRSGPIGPDVELIYETMQSPAKFAAFVGNAAGKLLNAYGGAVLSHFGWLFRAMTSSAVAGRLERTKPEKLLSDDGAGLRRYLETPVRLQLERELKGQALPDIVTIVFGHTHKPFEASMSLDNLGAYPAAIYNSGGWVVDRPHSQTLYGGAVVILDEDLNALSLRMYNEAADPAEFAVRVTAADDVSGQGNPLLDRIRSMIDPKEPPWCDFSRAAAEAVTTHTNKLAQLLVSA